MDFRETQITNPGPAGNVTQLARANSRRVFLGFSCSNGLPANATTNRGATVGAGIQFNNNFQTVPMPLRDWGMLIQQDWFSIEGAGPTSSFTVWEIIADTAAEMDEAAYGASDLAAIPRGLRWPTLGENPLPKNGGNAFETLLHRIKGELWRRLNQRNAAKKY